MAYTNAQLAVNDIDLFVNQHDAYGKGIIKSVAFFIVVLVMGGIL